MKRILAIIIAALLLGTAAFAEPGEETGLVAIRGADIKTNKPGTIEALRYNNGMDTAYVWMPAGYSPENRYNVVVALHGMGGYNKNFVSTYFVMVSGTFTMGTLYGMIHEAGYAEDFIVVAIDATNREHIAETMKDSLLPAVAEKFSTYAGSPELADISRAREHFAVCGVSSGANHVMALAAGIVDVFGNVIVASGDKWEDQDIIALAAAIEEYPLSSFICITDSLEGYVKLMVEEGFSKLLAAAPGLARYAHYVEISGAGHDWITWASGFYNAVGIMWPKL